MEYLLNPQEFFKRAKANKSLINSVVYLIVGAVLVNLSMAVTASKYSPFLSQLFSAGSLALLILTFFGGLLFSYIFQLTFTALGGKGRFMHGLTAIGYSLMLVSIALFLSSLFSLIPLVYGIPFGALLSLIAILIFGVLAFSSLYVGAKELFGVDMITAFVGVSVMTGTIFLLALLVSIFSFASFSGIG
ncbi:MAG: YIP1 family protein [Candidatus Aenigmarchaeota archaeon]|nr:YIP1 family protein [Candidatus Aenigmarchaeota archaeon]